MKIILSNIIEIQDPEKDIIKYCKEKLTIKNPEYSKKVQMGFFVGKTPKFIHLYDYDSTTGNIYLPIGCFNDIFQMYQDTKLYKDYSVKVPRKIKSSINLRDYQKPCLEALKTFVNGLFVLPCGLQEKQSVLYKQHIIYNNTHCL